jgi:DNA polymerase III subunit delta
MNKNLHLVIGDDEYMRRDEVEPCVLKALPKKEDRKNALHRFSVNEFSEETISAMKSLSFFSAHQVFIVSQVDKAKKRALELLAAYCQSPAESTTLILEGESFSGRDGQIKKIRAACQLHESKKHYESAVRGVMFEKLKKSDCTIEPDAAALLVERSGGSIAYLSSAIEKIILSCGAGTAITLSAVCDLVESHASFDVYKLTNAVADRDLKRALEVLDYLLREGSREIEIIGMLAWQMRRFYEAKILLEKKMPLADICKKLRVYGAFTDQFIRHVRSFSKRELASISKRLLEADANAKRSATDTRKDLEMLLVGLCRKKFV